MAYNVYPLVGPKCPLFVPVDPSKPKKTWRQWGRRPAQVLTFGDSSSASYFRAREAAMRRDEPHRRYGDASYPRIIAPIMKEDI